MNNLGLYLVSVLIWGSTWFVITFQLGRVPPEMSGPRIVSPLRESCS